MSRFLAAFKGADTRQDEKARFLAFPVPNKSEKADNRASGCVTPGICNRKQGYSDYSDYSELYLRKNALFEGVDPNPPPYPWNAIPAVPNDGTPQWVRDILEAEAPRPVFTPGQVTEPQAGTQCGCCKARSFWAEAVNPKGWRCSVCHPPLGLEADAVREFYT